MRLAGCFFLSLALVGVAGSLSALDDEAALLLQKGRDLVRQDRPAEALPFLEQSLDMLAVSPATRPRSVGLLSFELAEVYEKAGLGREAAAQLHHAWDRLDLQSAVSLLERNKTMTAVAHRSCALDRVMQTTARDVCRILRESSGPAAAPDRSAPGRVAPPPRRPPATSAETRSTRPTNQAQPRKAPTRSVFRVQMGARQDADEAAKDLKTIQSRYRDLIGTLPAHIETVRLEGRGVWHRLQYGDFATKSEARALCDAIKRRHGQDCWVAGPIEPARSP